MTNGEKIKEIFPSTDSRLDEKTGIMLVKWVDGVTKCFKADWWNAEYEEPTGKIDCKHTDCNNCVNHKYCDYEPTTKDNLGVDCVSRQEVDRLACRYLKEPTDNHVAFYEDFLDLPSVTPQSRKGHWIKVAGGSLIDDYRCDCCNHQPPIRKVGSTWGWDFTDYCPNCGAEMDGGVGKCR